MYYHRIHRSGSPVCRVRGRQGSCLEFLMDSIPTRLSIVWYLRRADTLYIHAIVGGDRAQREKNAVSLLTALVFVEAKDSATLHQMSLLLLQPASYSRQESPSTRLEDYQRVFCTGNVSMKRFGHAEVGKKKKKKQNARLPPDFPKIKWKKVLLLPLQ